LTIYVCSSNAGKLEEFALAAREARAGDLVIEPLPHLRAIAAPEENGVTFEENASAKALFYSGFTAELVLADDSGLEVEALGGAPGVQSARYAGPQATDAANNSLLLANLENLLDRRARFVCVLAIARAGEIVVTCRGTVEGEILSAPRGRGGFGYDPLFFYAPLNQSFGELSAEQKLAVSHRGRAVRELFRWLERFR
jgi:XTP/dITP diphosphohydrolase